jgi:hypothetical protein
VTILGRQCAWCGRPMPARAPSRAGRPPLYCRRSCRQRAYEARNRTGERARTEHELILERTSKHELADRLDVLARTMGDMEPDDDPAAALGWLREAVEQAVAPQTKP